MSRPVADPARNARICTLRREGMEPTDIAARLALTRNTVLGVLYRAGLTDKASPKAAARRVEPAYRRLVMDAVQRVGPDAAAAQWGVRANTVRRWVQGL